MSFHVGVLADTHGLLRGEVLKALDGSDHILHAGDIGDPQILDQLAQIAPLTAIRGNVDTWDRFPELSATEAVELSGKLFYLVHSVQDLDLNPVSAGIAVVVSGHSHQPGVTGKDGVLYLNPGSAGPRRFRLPISLARVEIADGQIACRLIELTP